MTRRDAFSRKIKLAAWCCVVLSLLFSAGEGLQLTPFAAPHESESSQFEPGSKLDAAFFAHGPIDIPVQFRNREKRDFNVFDLPPSPVVEDLLFQRTSTLISHEPAFFQLLTFTAPGRAPPAVPEV
jgi:hypothetical protein